MIFLNGHTQSGTNECHTLVHHNYSFFLLPFLACDIHRKGLERTSSLFSFVGLICEEFCSCLISSSARLSFRKTFVHFSIIVSQKPLSLFTYITTVNFGDQITKSHCLASYYTMHLSIILMFCFKGIVLNTAWNFFPHAGHGVSCVQPCKNPSL